MAPFLAELERTLTNPDMPITTSGTFAPGSSMPPPASGMPLAPIPSRSSSHRHLADTHHPHPSHLAAHQPPSETDQPDALDKTCSRAPPPSDSPTLAPPPLSSARKVAIASIVTFTIAMSSAGYMALTIALPEIQSDLGMTDTNLQWIQSAYGLTNACLLLVSGRAADVWGRKMVFLAGVGWYALWCLISGFLHNGIGLIIARAMAGIGAAMGTPSAIGIIAVNFEGHARSLAFASFSAGAPIGAAVGLVLGGVCTSYASTTWRACLYVLAAVSVPPAILAWFVVPADPPKSAGQAIDWLGAFLVTGGLILLQFVVSDGNSAPKGWKTPYIIVLLILGVLMVVAFFFWEKYVTDRGTTPPLMRLQLWTRARGKLASVYLIGFAQWMGFSSLFYHATLYYQEVQGTGSIGAMLRFLPCAVSGVLCNVVVAVLIRRVPTQWLVCVGVAATGGASIMFAVASPTATYWGNAFNAMWLCVLGADFLMATGSIFVAALAMPDEQSVAGAVFQTLIQLGGSFGLAITTLINDSYQTKATNAGKTSAESLLSGLRAAFYLGAGFCFGAFILAAIMLRGMGTIGKDVKGKEVKPARDEEAVDEKR